MEETVYITLACVCIGELSILGKMSVFLESDVEILVFSKLCLYIWVFGELDTVVQSKL